MWMSQPLYATRPDISVKIPPRASEIFHAFQVADAVFVRPLKTSEVGPAIKSGVCVCVQPLSIRPLIWAAKPGLD